jgi:DNA-binding PadR family transcriptional regulator
MHRHHRLRRHIGVPKGMLRHITLNILSQEPMSGSELTEQINDYTDWRPSPGSMYPLLASLQEEDLIMPYEDEDKTLKRFTLTDEGMRLVEIYKREDQEYRNRHKSMRKMYWRLHRDMPLKLYTSFSRFLDTFEEVFTEKGQDESTKEQITAILDGSTGKLEEILDR